ncbi:MAG: diacylglycerol kinase family lipid kinase [Kiritimatiellae bacterium]|nr:diacylglycerol kinase family lipid kinase [Kiritimatiellia bacterium]MDW8458853.1 diacylglycerol kinase family lipid kinase [Verrucomicrobiota bacterium]
MKRVRVLINPNSARGNALDEVIRAVNRYWDTAECEVTFQISNSIQDGHVKVRRMVQDGIDLVLVVGGDGVINTAGSELIGSNIALGVIPTGSGNGFARHFGIPLNVEAAAVALADGEVCPIDVGFANGRPFFVTCSMAADASLVRTFEAFPFRGIMPYVFAAAYELFEYQPQRFEVVLDDDEKLVFQYPLVFTVANLTQYGGGARIAPKARHDDGYLEMVVLEKQDAARAIANVGRLFDGTIDRLPGIVTRRFRSMRVRREKAAVIQVDGELQESGPEVEVAVRPAGLNVLVPRRPASPES